ncbi:ribitol 5-phosphate transferase FKRP-like [Saccoglossus kowalevskii]
MLLFASLYLVDNLMGTTHGGWYDECYTPPNKLDDLRYAVRQIINITEELNITYWLDCGTLLGAIRSGDILRYDHDADISIVYKPTTAIQISHLLKNAVNNIGMKYISFGEINPTTKRKETSFGRVRYNDVYIDIYGWQIRDGVFQGRPQQILHKPYPDYKMLLLNKLIEKYVIEVYEFPLAWLHPRRQIEFIGIKAMVPNNADALLTALYPFKKFAVPYKLKCWLPF